MNTTTTPTTEAPKLTVEALALLRRFISPLQMAVLHHGLQGEERQFFIEKLASLAALIASMPVTYEQAGKGDDAMIYLHYFAGGQARESKSTRGEIVIDYLSMRELPLPAW